MGAIYAIPHDGSLIPSEEYKYFNVSKSELERLADELRDKYVMSLFSNAKITVKNYISRYIIDVERFTDDSIEQMAQVGMGVYYTRSHYGKHIRDYNEKHREKLISTYYEEYHKRLNQLTFEQLEINNKALIIDCHSFNGELAYIQKGELPDVCIGYDTFHCESGAIDIIKNAFSDYGYSVEIGVPFNGSIVPTKYYNKDNRVKSVMIEINRRIYMNKLEDYYKVKNICNEITKELDKISEG